MNENTVLQFSSSLSFVPLFILYVIEKINMVSSMKKSLIVVWLFHIIFAACMNKNQLTPYRKYKDDVQSCEESIGEIFLIGETVQNFILGYSKLTETSFQNHITSYGYYLDLFYNALNAVNFNSWTPELYCSDRQSLTLQECLEAMRDSKLKDTSLIGSEALEVFYLDFTDDDFNVKTANEELNNTRLEKIFPNWINSIPEDKNGDFVYVNSVKQSFINKVDLIKGYMSSFYDKFNFTSESFDNPLDYCKRKMSKKLKKNSSNTSET